jgi:hypothetical protein
VTRDSLLIFIILHNHGALFFVGGRGKLPLCCKRTNTTILTLTPRLPIA